MASKKKDARTEVTLECTVCKSDRGVSKENYRVEKSKVNTPDRLELNKYCPTCRKHTIHKEKK